MSEIAERERTLASRLRVAVVRLNRRLRAQSTGSAITLSQLSALFCLNKVGPMTPGELAAKEGVQPPSMTRVIAALEDSGLVVRRAHPTDGRQAIVELTDAGKARIDEEVSARERWLDLQLADLTEEERTTLCRAAEIIDRLASR
ncbi:DNA-binding MarR family transcriptional regulator [Saccharopolyspora erythraea NRRL 2338]|uniref:Transcriptional regulator, MarR family n=2 Tax=Saccharopolyspora erythraea TaxID=1836 RepID=A4F7D2_SACEN|nr:MarR family transcriptional regulator [Saccharopolyspora erythraea]EQD83602.1 MarR family transcriptional regulator [Saccharopolyspora erythraea D]PFG93758.1 DNA-binding MarR family transcriptional regulator [Saccharopolyspora erythraea NRRL 2338]QRK90595.1 MarR family transcriptional regulator [Saccharopolyspora erythraea]QUG99955.1 MarR family transcriptional regulator [Saccharopolyspora erythraea]CAL99956.1 transcriptional regulator, MarR family [Saccharopolyspora erythraea NRRL 2338]